MSGKDPTPVFEFFRAFHFAILKIRPILADNIVEKNLDALFVSISLSDNISFVLIQLTVSIMDINEKKNIPLF